MAQRKITSYNDQLDYESMFWAKRNQFALANCFHPISHIKFLRAMNPYQEVTDVHIATIESAIQNVIGAPWDGIKNPHEFLREVAGLDLANEYVVAVDMYCAWRDYFGAGSAEKPFDEVLFRAWRQQFGAGSAEKYGDELFRGGGHPLINQSSTGGTPAVSWMYWLFFARRQPR